MREKVIDASTLQETGSIKAPENIQHIVIRDTSENFQAHGNFAFSYMHMQHDYNNHLYNHSTVKSCISNDKGTLV